MDIFQGGARLNTGPRSRSRQASVAGSNENLIDDKVRDKTTMISHPLRILPCPASSF